MRTEADGGGPTAGVGETPIATAPSSSQYPGKKKGCFLPTCPPVPSPARSTGPKSVVPALFVLFETNPEHKVHLRVYIW